MSDKPLEVLVYGLGAYVHFDCDQIMTDISEDRFILCLHFEP